MDKHAYIFIGQSGAGKGTQANLLAEKIQSKYSDDSLFRLETGAIFRSFIKEDSYAATKTKDLIYNGKLPPSFIAIHAWSHQLISGYRGQDYVLIDGTPRRTTEVPILLSAAEFYQWKLSVIYLEVSDEKSAIRLIKRGREDDSEEADRAERIDWFHKNVIPAIEQLKSNESVNFFSINGERSIMEIHQDICKKLGL